MKKVPLQKVLKKEEEKLPTPRVRTETPVTPKKDHSNKDDFNKERDSRTIFVKNLPFDTTVADLWYVFGKDEEMTIDCRFIMNRETGTHKVLVCLSRRFLNLKRDSHSLNTRREKNVWK